MVRASTVREVQHAIADLDRQRSQKAREMGFRSAMRSRHSDRSLVEIDNSDGLDETMRGLVLAGL